MEIQRDVAGLVGNVYYEDEFIRVGDTLRDIHKQNGL